MANAAELAAEIKVTGVKEATKQVKELTNSFGFLGNVISAAQLALDLVGTGAQRGVQIAREIDRVTFKTGIGTQAFQRLDYAFKQHGGNVNSLISSYQSLQKRVAQWKFMGGIGQTEGRALGILGIDPSQYGNTMDLMQDITESLLKIKDIGQRNMLAAILGIDEDFLRIAEKGKYYVNDLLKLSSDEQKILNDWEQNSTALFEDFEDIFTKLGVMVLAGPGKDFTQWLYSVDQNLSNAVDHANDLHDVLDNLGGSTEDRNWFGRIVDFFDDWGTATYDVFSGKGLDYANKDIDKQREIRAALRRSRMAGKSAASIPSDVKNLVEHELRAGGLKGYGVAGALGNIMQESTFNPTISNGSHWGLVQWDKFRQAELQKFAKGADISDPRIQARFLMQEIRQRGLLDRLNNAKSPEEAARIFEQGIEVSGKYDKNTGRYGNVQNLPERMRYARQFSNEMMDRYIGVADSQMMSADNRNVTINMTNENIISANNVDKASVMSISEESFGQSIRQAGQIVL